MSSSASGATGVLPLHVMDPPAFGEQTSTTDHPKGSTLPLKFDPHRRESRPQHPSPSAAELLNGQRRSPQSLGTAGGNKGSVGPQAPAKSSTSPGTRLLSQNNSTPLQHSTQRRLSDPQQTEKAQTTKVYVSEGGTNNAWGNDKAKPSQGSVNGMVASLSSGDAPPGFLGRQATLASQAAGAPAAPPQIQGAENMTRQSRPSKDSDPNPLAQATSSSNRNEETNGSKLTGSVVPLLAVENGQPEWKRECEWLQVPILFYFFATLIEFRERQENYVLEGQFMDTAYEQLLELNTLAARITYCVDEIKGILLNRLFTSWSDATLRKRVHDVATEWTKSGPRSDGFRDSSLALMDDISEDRACAITYTHVFLLRQFVGSKDTYGFSLTGVIIAFVVCIVCIVLQAVFGRTHLVACIVLSAVLGVFIILGVILFFLLLHHNYYADAAEKFFRAQSLSVAKEDINVDDDSMRNLWMDPMASLPNPTAGPATLNNHTLEWKRQNAGNTLLMSPLNFEKNQENVTQLQTQFLRESLSLSDGDLRSGSIDSLIGKNSSQQIVNSLTESISVTALLYCTDREVVESVSITLWKNNFYVFCSTDMTALDRAYRRGSERFKVMLVSVRDLGTNGARLKTALDWVQQRRPIFFLSETETGFPELVPATARVRVPLTPTDVRRILLAGIAIREEDMQLRDDPNCNVPNYTLGRRLGGGAFGNVFEAQLEGSGAKCAVKRMYLKESAEDGNAENPDGPSKQLRDIAQEVEIMSSLTHPNIVQYLFCQRDDNCISIFMELCSGGSLSALIKKNEINDAESIKRILTEILRAVAYLHNKRIVHRDLKPDNVLFRNNHAKLTDFGTAVHKRGELNIVTGTFAYMAPEILVGDSYGKECDIWSVGCIAAEMLSIDLPQRGMGPPEMATLYRQMPLDSAATVECDKPDVTAFLTACLQRNPANRPSANGLLNYRMLSKESNDVAEWLVEVGAKKKQLKSQQSGALTHNPSFDLDSSDMSLQSDQ